MIFNFEIKTHNKREAGLKRIVEDEAIRTIRGGYTHNIRTIDRQLTAMFFLNMIEEPVSLWELVDLKEIMTPEALATIEEQKDNN